ncbi:MAG: UDP-N-acetylmuramoyl-L-alanine--D-glutamate ligase [Treponemataceae bacterium]
MNQYCFSEKSPFVSLQDIKGKKITLMGLGLNGGGLATVSFFLRYGAYIHITDMKDEKALESSLVKIAEDPFFDPSKISYRFGEHKIDDFTSCDVVIKNPGVKFEGNAYLQSAIQNNISIETDISLFLHFTKAPIIAITGSKGKSSTASAISFCLERGHLLHSGVKSFLGGNITVSPLTFLEQTNETTPVILELSSWQLSDLRGRKLLKPKIAVLTSIIPDHQNWYGNMENYVADKKLIYADQTSDEITICKYNDQWGDLFARETKGTVYRYTSEHIFNQENKIAGAFLGENKNGFFYNPATNKEEMILSNNLLVKGEHMRENLLVTALVLHSMNIDAKKSLPVLEQFSGISHRLEYFHEYKNNSKSTIRFYNDSAATIPEACIAALNAFENPFLICGGTDKNLDFTPFLSEYAKAKKIYFLSGTATDKLLPLLQDKHIAHEGVFDNLENLLMKLKNDLINIEHKSICVVFSPGATSFGMFKNEFERGDNFKKLVLKLF